MLKKGFALFWCLMGITFGYATFMPFTGPRAEGFEEALLRIAFAIIAVSAMVMALDLVIIRRIVRS